MNFDRFFKIGILILGVFFLMLYYQGSRNGRYVIRKSNLSEGETILDTRSGTLYILTFVKDKPCIAVIDPKKETFFFNNLEPVFRHLSDSGLERIKKSIEDKKDTTQESKDK